MKALASSGDFKGVLGDLFVKIELDEDKKELRIIDRGIGMTEEEVDKYIIRLHSLQQASSSRNIRTRSVIS